MHETMLEEWKDVLGYEGRYEISNLGQVRRKETGCILRQSTHYKGHKYIQFKVSRIKRKYFVHRLVAIAFIPLVVGKDIVNHIDGNKQNNCYLNLEWATVKENTQHYYTSVKALKERTLKAI